MRNALKKSPAAAATLPSTHATTRSRSDFAGASRAKTGRRKAKSEKLKDRDLVFILRNLATLTSSGVSLPKALGTLAEEKALEKHRDMLQSIRRHLENGESFSASLAHFGATFDNVMVSQIKVGEHSGTLNETLTTIARHREEGHRLRSEIIKKLAYPILLMVMGSLVITF